MYKQEDKVVTDNNCIWASAASTNVCNYENKLPVGLDVNLDNLYSYIDALNRVKCLFSRNELI